MSPFPLCENVDTYPERSQLHKVDHLHLYHRYCQLAQYAGSSNHLLMNFSESLSFGNCFVFAKEILIVGDDFAAAREAEGWHCVDAGHLVPVVLE